MPKSRSKRVRRQPPPKAKPKKSPMWVGAIFGVLMAAGVIVIIGNYAGLFPPAASNPRLFYGLGLILVAFMVATRWH